MNGMNNYSHLTTGGYPSGTSIQLNNEHPTEDVLGYDIRYDGIHPLVSYCNSLVWKSQFFHRPIIYS